MSCSVILPTHSLEKKTSLGAKLNSQGPLRNPKVQKLRGLSSPYCLPGRGQRAILGMGSQGRERRGKENTHRLKTVQPVVALPPHCHHASEHHSSSLLGHCHGLLPLLHISTLSPSKWIRRVFTLFSKHNSYHCYFPSLVTFLVASCCVLLEKISYILQSFAWSSSCLPLWAQLLGPLYFPFLSQPRCLWEMFVE